MGYPGYLYLMLCLQFLIHQGFTLTTIPRTVHPNDVTFTAPFTTTTLIPTLMDAQWSWTLKYHDERPQYYSQAANAFLEWDALQTSWKITRKGLKWCRGWPGSTPSQVCQSYQDTNVGCDRSIAGDCFEKGTDACEAMAGCAGVASVNNGSWTAGHVRLCTAQGNVGNNSEWNTSWKRSGDECVLLAKWKDIDVYDPAKNIYIIY